MRIINKLKYNKLEIKYIALLESHNAKLEASLNKFIRYEELREENNKLRKKIRDLKKQIK